MRVLMTGGGTAGHVNPAIAIANTIKEYEGDSEIAFVCSISLATRRRILCRERDMKSFKGYILCPASKYTIPKMFLP